MSKKIIRKIITFLLRYSFSKKIDDLLLWPISKRLFSNYTEIVEIKKDLKIKVYGDMEDMVNKILLFSSKYVDLAWEPGTARLADLLSIDSKCAVVAGSHIGYYPLILGKANSNIKVFAFEPNPLNRERCIENVKLNKLQNISIYDVALGAKDRQQKMFFDYGQSSFVDSNRRHFGEGIVKINTLDLFLKDKNIKPDLIILDAEKKKKKILEGGSDTLFSSYPTIIFELNPSALKAAGSSPEKLNKILNEKGYSIFIINEGNHGICFNSEIKISLIPYDKYNLENVSFVNAFAIINTDKIKQYVN